MPKKRYNAEEIIQKVRGADVLLSKGKTVSPKQPGEPPASHRQYQRHAVSRIKLPKEEPAGSRARGCMIAPRGFVHQGQLEDPLRREAALRVRADLDSPIAEQRQHRRPALRWTVIGTVMTREYPRIPVDA